ncbi:MAG TPA: DUF2203 family protein [Thermoanaerobaculia bacterium]|nr:DUF2203 family protein [Thermoanaerobaculia bacterium]
MPDRKIFSYEDAIALLPEVQRLTHTAVETLESLVSGQGDTPIEAEIEFERIVDGWARSIMALGIDVKGLWLIDFDNGSGYYCWKYPETSLQYFHGYEEGFSGRVKLN